MNIAMISYHTCPLATLGGKDTGGMNVYVRELTSFLGKLGVHVDVFTRSQDEHVPHILHDLCHGNRVVHIPAGPEVPLPKKELATHIPQFVEGIQHFAAQKKIHYDLIHSHYWMSGVAAGALKESWDVPVVEMFHTLGKMKNRVARSEGEIEGAYRLDGEAQVLKIADRIVAATQAEVAQLEFLYQADANKISVIPPGVDTARFYPIPPDEAKEAIGLAPDEKVLLFVGRIEPLKGVDTLIRAAAAMRNAGVQEKNPFTLVVIGGDPNASPELLNSEFLRLRNLCGELGVCKTIVFLGKRSQDSLPYYYSAAEVLVMPSHYESFGMVALEAMACGTPVVASQVGGLAFLVQDGVTGYVVPSDDPEALGQRLTELITQPDLRQRMGSQAAIYARAYAWENIAQQMLTLYSQVLQGLPVCAAEPSM